MSIKLFVKEPLFYGFIGVFIKFDSLTLARQVISQKDLTNLKINGEVVDDQDLAHFDGLDLDVKVTKMIISNTNGPDFAKKAFFLIKLIHKY